MAIEAQTYTMPLTGTMLDWANLRGDPNDSVRCSRGVRVFINQWMERDVDGRRTFPAGIPADEERISIELQGYDPDAGTAEIVITAPIQFHAAFRLWLQTATLQERTGDRPQLKRPTNAPVPLIDPRTAFGGAPGNG